MMRFLRPYRIYQHPLLEPLVIPVGFSWFTLLLPWLSCLKRRLWITAGSILLIQSLLVVAARAQWLHVSVLLIIIFSIHLAASFFINDWHSWLQERQGDYFQGVIFASSKLEAALLYTRANPLSQDEF